MGKIVVLDDDRVITLLVKSALKLQDFDVVGITDPDEAVPTLEKMDVDLLVTDIMMPGTDGFEVCRQVRRHPDMKDLMILVLTAKQLSVEERKELMELDAEVIIKPFSPLTIREKILKLLS